MKGVGSPHVGLVVFIQHMKVHDTTGNETVFHSVTATTTINNDNVFQVK